MAEQPPETITVAGQTLHRSKRYASSWASENGKARARYNRTPPWHWSIEIQLPFGRQAWGTEKTLEETIATTEKRAFENMAELIGWIDWARGRKP